MHCMKDTWSKLSYAVAATATSVFNPVAPKREISPAVTRNITSHSMENLDYSNER